MDQQLELESKRKEIAREILSFKRKTAPALTIEIFGKLLPRKLSDGSFTYWILIVVMLNLAMWVPGLLVSSFLGEPRWDTNIWFSWFIGVQTCMSALLVSSFALQNLFDELATRVVSKIINRQDLDEFLQWVYSSWSIKKIIGVVIMYCGLWTFLGVWGISKIRGGFVGVGPTTTAAIGGILLGISVNYLIWLIFLSQKLAGYSYDLNVVLPARSEIINVLTNMFNKHLYITSGFFGIATLVVSFIKITNAVFPLILLGWLVIILQFLFNRNAINKIIDTVKWITLNNLQEQVNHLMKSQDLSEKESAEKLSRLTEIYERIVTSRTNTFDLKSLTTFTSQLMLPLLGLLLGNLDKVIALLR